MKIKDRLRGDVEVEAEEVTKVAIMNGVMLMSELPEHWKRLLPEAMEWKLAVQVEARGEEYLVPTLLGVWMASTSDN